MKPVQSLRLVATAVLGIGLLPAVAWASPLAGEAAGLASPAVTVTFDEHVLTQDDAVTNQYADVGVTFTPYLYYSPFDPDGPYYATRSGNYLGNFADGSFPDPVQFVIGFTTTQDRAAFGMQSNGTPWSFEALLDGDVVESFIADVGDAYYGFTGISFNAIRVTSLPQVAARNGEEGSDDVAAFGSDYMGLDSLQFGTARVNPAAVPEPGSLALCALGVLGLAHARRRSRITRRA